MAPTVSHLRRGKDDEKADLDDAIERFYAAAYTDWPNEAGFDGLTEERGPVETTVVGNIPSWVAGSLYRTGPGVYTVEDTPKGTYYTSHWFDGLAQTHRFDIIPDGQNKVEVLYSSRRQSEQMIQHIKKTGDRKFFSFAQRQDPCIGLFSKMMSTWQAATAPPEDKWIENVCVVVNPNYPGLDKVSGNLFDKIPQPSPGPIPSSGHRNLPSNIWLTTDNCNLKQMDPQTLEPIGFATQSNLHPLLNGPLSCAHAHRDAVTGDLYNFNEAFGRETTYRVFAVRAATGKTDILATITGKGIKAAYIHSFFMTENYLVLVIPSSHIGWGGIKVPWQRNIVDAIEPFNESKKMQWIVVDKTGGKGVVGRGESPAGFFFHSINAYEKDGKIVCDVMDYKNMNVIHKLYYDVILQKDGADRRFWGDKEHTRAAMVSCSRYELTLPSGKKDKGLIKVEKVSTIPGPHAGELPTINPLYATRSCRYVYSLPYQGRSTTMDGLVKTDMVTREVLYWDCPQGHNPGEAIFVPRPGADVSTEEGEDDGVLLSVVVDGHKKTSYLLCLDAKSMTEVGRAEIGFPIAIGFHGTHVATS
ncbi:carotenoid oxygenase [Podospora fimiseda]|uniref:Carotenoid oxygenase n=1 Tax=Podospora fimiseda TaxID=252190 RepID=A0AAN7GWX9_9PEZI|nr:carotenoid oxygenase [Podospora fimiseda]